MPKELKYEFDDYTTEITFSDGQVYKEKIQGISFVYAIDWAVKTAINMEQFKGLNIIKVTTNKIK